MVVAGTWPEQGWHALLWALVVTGVSTCPVHSAESLPHNTSKFKKINRSTSWSDQLLHPMCLTFLLDPRFTCHFDTGSHSPMPFGNLISRQSKAAV